MWSNKNLSTKKVGIEISLPVTVVLISVGVLPEKLCLMLCKIKWLKIKEGKVIKVITKGVNNYDIYHL